MTALTNPWPITSLPLYLSSLATGNFIRFINYSFAGYIAYNFRYSGFPPFIKQNIPKTHRKALSEVLYISQHVQPTPSKRAKESEIMPSSKGEPTDPKLRDEVKEEVKAESKGKSESLSKPDL